ncbi:unnamed protein product [Pylaiella littoralis]
MASCYGSIGELSSTGPTVVAAFRASPPRMTSNAPNGNTRIRSQQLDTASLEAARELILKETTGSKRVTKKALLESVGYGVMDPLAYQTFEDSPLLPKLRPTTHVRIAEGIHSFGQEFLGVPRNGAPETGSFMFPPESVTPATTAVSTQNTIAAGGGSPQFELHPKLPGLGMRMTVVRLGNGELLVHSPVAPTVELLDMMRDSFSAVGPTAKVHLFSASVSPEHWAFLKCWKEIFPSAEIWSVPGPHRRFMGVEVRHDLEHISRLPEQLGGEVEVAVLEGVPMVREAVLFHRPTGTVLSANLLLAMNRNTLEQRVSKGGGQQRGSGPPLTLYSPPSSSPTPLESSFQKPKKFGEHTDRPAKIETVTDSGMVKGGRLQRVRWRLLDRTASLLAMNTLAVFTPVKTLMRAFKGNSAALSARVLGWDAKIFVACHGEAPLEGPELKDMLYAALGRYVRAPKKKRDKTKLGTHLLGLIPGRHGGQRDDGEPDGIFEKEGHWPDVPPVGGGGCDGSGSGPFSSREPQMAGTSQRQQREIRRPPNQQQQPPATETKSTATSSSTDLAGGTITSSGTGSIGFENETNIPGASAAAANASVSRAAMSEVEKRARQYVQEKANATEGLKADNVTATTEGIVGGTGKQSSGKQSPLSSSRTQKALEAKRRSAKVGNERSSTLPKKNAAEGGAKDSGNPFVVGPDLRYDERPPAPMKGDSKSDDPFDAPFYPFTDEGPLLNGRPLDK